MHLYPEVRLCALTLCQEEGRHANEPPEEGLAGPNSIPRLSMKRIMNQARELRRSQAVAGPLVVGLSLAVTARAQ